MIKLEISPKKSNALFYETIHNPHHKIRYKMLVLYLKSLNFQHQDICSICQITKPTLTAYLKQYKQGDLDGLKELKWKGQPSELNEHQELMKQHFEKAPVNSVSEAQYRIEQLTDIKRSPTQIREFMKKIGLKFLKAGSVPEHSKMDHKEKEKERAAFKKNLKKNLKPQKNKKA